MNRKELAKMVDHTNLYPYATVDDIQQLFQEAINWDTHSVCVASCWISFAQSFLTEMERPDIVICSVIGFPHGNQRHSVKLAEAKKALNDGARELDPVINIGFMKGRQYYKVGAELKEIMKVAQGFPVKVITENCYLTYDEKIVAGEILHDAGVTFWKNGTGFGQPSDGRPKGAIVEDVILMRETIEHLGSSMQIKMAGGISDYPAAMAMIEAGADRLGLSRTVKILEEAPEA